MKKEMKEQVIAAIKANIASHPNFYIVDKLIMQNSNKSINKHNDFQSKIKLNKQYILLFIFIFMFAFFVIIFFVNNININLFWGENDDEINIDYNSVNMSDIMKNFENIEYIYKYNNRDIKIKNESDFLEICKEKKEIEIQDLYFRICEKGVLFNKKIYENVENPKISIILTLLNRENYLLRILRSIQNQPMKDIEIIFIDDGSTDNSVNIIKFHQQYDKRIILIKHEKNEGTLKSRNDGAYLAKGEYFLFSDSDDLLLYDILNKTYDAAKTGNYEIVQFAVYRRNTKGDMWNYGEIRNTTPIYQPELSSLMYYYRGYLKQTDWHIWGKLIKREAFYRALEFIGDYYLNTHMSVNEDGLVDFMLLKKAESYIYIKDYGYVYFANPRSVILSIKKTINKALRDYFLYLKYLFEKTENNNHEKAMAGEQLRYVYNKFYHNFKETTENFEFYYEVLNLFINSRYINRNNRNRAKKIKEIFEETQKELLKKEEANNANITNITNNIK